MQTAANMQASAQIAARPADLVIDWARDKLHLDNRGRWLSFRYDGALHRRALDGSVWISPCTMVKPVAADAEAAHERVRLLATRMLRELPEAAHGQIQWSLGEDGVAHVGARLQLASQWDASRYREEAARYVEAYPEPVRILPPDRIRDVVVIPAQGCPHGRCEFCAFYRDATYKVLSEAEFERHLSRVAELLGDSHTLRSGVFLGGANALSLSQRRLLGIITQTRTHFGQKVRGMAAFWDPDHSPLRDVHAWGALREAGLTAVYAGLETGYADARAKLGKAVDVKRFVERVRDAKRAGLTLGVIVLAGVEAPPEAHVRATATAIVEMELTDTDIVFVSPLDTAPPAEADAEADLLAHVLRHVTHARVAPYRMEAFRYYA